MVYTDNYFCLKTNAHLFMKQIPVCLKVVKNITSLHNFILYVPAKSAQQLLPARMKIISKIKHLQTEKYNLPCIALP